MTAPKKQRSLKHELIEPDSGYVEEDLLDIFGKKNVVARGGDRFTVRDTELNQKFDIDLSTGNADKNISVFEAAGIFIGGVAEFYLDTMADEIDSDFKLGKIEVTIETASPLLYFLIGRDNEDIGLGYELQDAATIRLKNVTKENVLEYLDKALFKAGVSKDMGIVWPSVGTEDNSPEYFSEYLQEFYQLIADRDFRFTAPINCFNGAMRSGNKLEKFLGLYKILEFFWNSALEEKIVKLRKSKLGDGPYARAIIELNLTREINRFELFLTELIDDDLKEFIEEDVGLTIKSMSDFAKEIYDFRNSVVHAKQERIEEPEPYERYKREFVNESLLEAVEYLALKAIEKWGLI